MKSIFEEMGGTYRREGDYNFANGLFAQQIIDLYRTSYCITSPFFVGFIYRGAPSRGMEISLQIPRPPWGCTTS